MAQHTGQGMKLPAEPRLTWWLQHGEAAMGRSSAYCAPSAPTKRPTPKQWEARCAELGTDGEMHAKGGGSRGPESYERGVTDQRHGWGCREDDDDPGRLASIADAEATESRHLRRRWRSLAASHRDVLFLAYGISYPSLSQQVLDASDPEAWQALEAAFGPLAAVALFLAPDVQPHAMSKVRTKNGGAWDTPTARHLIAMSVARGKALEAAQGAALGALDGALVAWRATAPPAPEAGPGGRQRRAYVMRRDPATLWTAPSHTPPPRVMGAEP